MPLFRGREAVRLSSTEITQFPLPASFRSQELPEAGATTVGCESGWKPEVNCQVTALNMLQVMSSPCWQEAPQSAWLPVREPRRALQLFPKFPACRRSVPTTRGRLESSGPDGPHALQGAPGRLQPAPQAGANASCLLQAPGEQVSGAREDLDSYIDFSLESLNQMILELDPTFQLLPPGPGGLRSSPPRALP